MLTWLDEITVSGGDGCAEYAMTGILKGKLKIESWKINSLSQYQFYWSTMVSNMDIGCFAGIEMSNNDSNIYFVTGADAKDVYLKQGVINGLKGYKF